jgi:hypothetical protein
VAVGLRESVNEGVEVALGLRLLLGDTESVEVGELLGLLDVEEVTDALCEVESESDLEGDIDEDGV